jgi:transposase
MNMVERLEQAGEVLSPGVRAAMFALEAQLGVALARISELEGRVRELERRLSQNSTNSSLPPSKDPPGTARPATKKSKRKRGAQPGHRRHEREMLPPERVDQVIEHYPSSCQGCGADFLLWPEASAPERRQVIEMPPLRAEVTEHRLHRLLCTQCQSITAAEAPAGVEGAVVFGPRLVSFVAAVTVRLRASRRNLHALLGDVLDVPAPCVGQMQALLEEASRASLPAYQEARTALRQSLAAGVDETGWTLRGRRYWLWAGTTRQVSVFRLARQRSRTALSRLMGRRYGGILTSDRLGTYAHRDPERRQLCWAHLTRDFIGWQKRGGQAERLGRAAEAETRRIFHLWHRFARGEIDRRHLRSCLRLAKARFTRLLYRGALCGEPKLEKTCESLLLSWPALWSFAEHEGVEPTNNETERALRTGVIWRKTSFGSQSGRGLRLVERLLTVAETCKKQKKDLLAYLMDAITAYRLGHAAPALLPRP